MKVEEEEEEEEDAEDQLVNSNDVQVGRGREMVTVTVDEVVEGYVGSLGFSQLLHVFLVSMAWIFDSQNTLVTIFTDAQPSTWGQIRCVGHGRGGYSLASPPPWPCAVGGGGGDGINASSYVVCGVLEVATSTTTTIAEWSLICDRKFLAAVPASLFFLGSLSGSGVYGWLADSLWGRKKTVLISCLLTSLTAFLTSLSPNLCTYALLRFASGFARSGIGMCCLVLSTEVVGRNYRAQVGQYGFLFFTVGFLSLPLIAYHTRTSWRNTYRVISLLPLLYSLFVLPFVAESPRWLLIRGRSKEAIHVLNRFAQLNGKNLPTNICLSDPSHDSHPAANSGTKMSLWTTKWAAKRMITVMMAGFGVGFVYYGVQLNVENLNFNLYFTVALNAAMEIPAVFIGSVLLSFTNRRLLFLQSACIAGVSCILCMVFSRGSWPQLGIEAIGFMAASMAFDVLYIYCVELFPTNVRNFAVSLLRQALMLGASVAPLLVVLGRLSSSLSFLVFGGFSVFSGILSLWLPETRNAPLYETLEQQEEVEEEKLCSVSQELELGVVDQL